jgi:general secretion pathway protein K
MKQFKSKQKGVALIIVLLIVAIVSVLATEMGGRLQLQVKRASNIKENNQAYWYALGAEQFARKSLKQLFEDDGSVIHLDQPWNQEFTYPIEGGGIQAQLTDMQSCFNLNSLKVDSTSPVSTEEKEAFHRLLQAVEPQIPSYNAELLHESLVDWLDENDNPTGIGAEDSEYESLQFPYIAANNFMINKSELRLVHGVEMSWLRELLELVCVLPNDETFLINVNTITEKNAAVLAAAANISLADSKSVLSSRGNEGFDKIQTFLGLPSIKAANMNPVQEKWFAITTEHFILDTKARYNNATFAMQSVLKVDNDNKVHVIRREFSGF